MQTVSRLPKHFSPNGELLRFRCLLVRFRCLSCFPDNFEARNALAAINHIDKICSKHSANKKCCELARFILWMMPNCTNCCQKTPKPGARGDSSRPTSFRPSIKIQSMLKHRLSPPSAQEMRQSFRPAKRRILEAQLLNDPQAAGIGLEATCNELHICVSPEDAFKENTQRLWHNSHSPKFWHEVPAQCAAPLVVGTGGIELNDVASKIPIDQNGRRQHALCRNFGGR